MMPTKPAVFHESPMMSGSAPTSIQLAPGAGYAAVGQSIEEVSDALGAYNNRLARLLVHLRGEIPDGASSNSAPTPLKSITELLQDMHAQRWRMHNLLEELETYI